MNYYQKKSEICLAQWGHEGLQPQRSRRRPWDTSSVLWGTFLLLSGHHKNHGNVHRPTITHNSQNSNDVTNTPKNDNATTVSPNHGNKLRYSYRTMWKTTTMNTDNMKQHIGFTIHLYRYQK